MGTQKSVAFHTLGCKLNFSETSSIRRQFEGEGYDVVGFDQGADYYVLNTCSVTEFADRKCRYEVRRAQKHNPDAKIIVIGCYAQLKPQEIAEIEGVDLVLGAGEKFRILSHINAMDSMALSSKVKASTINEVNSFVDAFSFGDRTRSFLKVQDGCNYKCSFCTIPLARGKSRSDTVENVVNNANKIAGLGIKEIVLTGVNIGDFGNGTEVIEGVKPKKEAMFVDLIQALEDVEGIDRFRISSIEPNLCSYEVIDFVAESSKFMPHFHMPLQSGSNDMLKKMRRRYKRELYADRVAYIKNRMPHCCIGADVIVGSPGETEEHFEETYRFIETLDVSYLHVFTYSARANTVAANMNNQVALEVRKARNARLRELSASKRQAFYQSLLGQTRPVLLETKNELGTWVGFTDNYAKLELDGTDASLETNMVVKAQLLSFAPSGNIKASLKHNQVSVC